MKKKSVLIIGNYFYPDVASLGQIITDYSIELKNDFDITVIAAIPNYSSNIDIDDDLKTKKYYSEVIKGVKVIRIVVPNVDKRNKASRVNYILTYYKNAKKAIDSNLGFDIVLTVSQPPILGGLLGRYAKKKNRNSRLIYNIQDFNPEQIEAVGFSNVKLLIKILKIIDNMSINSSDKVLLVGRDQIPTIEKRKKSFKDKVIVINNWSNDKEIVPLEPGDDRIIKFKKEHGLEDKFIVMYSGNIGLFYDLQNIIHIALDHKENDNIMFVFIGEGAVKKDLEEFKEKNNLSNIKFIPYQDKKDLVVSLNVADVHLVVNAKGIKGVSVPSKLYGVMSAGKAVLGVLEKDSEARTLIEASNCGICVEPGEYKQISDAVETLFKNKEKVFKLGKNGREYLEDNLSREKAIFKYKKLLQEL